MDVDEAKYHRGEMLLIIQQMDHAIEDLKREQVQFRDDPEEIADIKAAIIACKGNKEEAQETIDTIDGLLHLLTTREIALSTFKKAQASRRLNKSGLHWYYTGEGKLPYENIMRAVRSIGDEIIYHATDGYYYTVEFTLPEDTEIEINQ